MSDLPPFPALETRVEIHVGDRTIPARVVGVHERSIVVERPEEQLPSKVVVQWSTGGRTIMAEALPAVTSPRIANLAVVRASVHERRRSERRPVPFHCAVEGHVKGADGKNARAFAGKAVDVSSTGLAIATAVDIPAGAIIEITVRRPDGAVYLRGRKARVAHRRESGGRYVLGCDLAVDAPGELGLAALVEDVVGA